MGKILIIAGDGTAIDHLDYAYFRMQEAGLEVTIASPARRDVKSSVHWGGPDTYLYYIELPGYYMPCTTAFEDVDPSDYDGILLPGGRAPEYLRNDETCIALIRHFVENDKPIGTLCHGPLLAVAGGVSGRQMVCADDAAFTIKKSGNTYVENKGEIPGTPDFIVDGNLVSARGYWHYYSWCREFLRLLEARGVKVKKTASERDAKILILAGEHSSAGQLSYALERSLEAGYVTKVAAPKHGIIRTIIDSREEGWDLKADTGRPYDFEGLGFLIPADLTIDEVNPADYDAVLVPGGRAPEYLANIKAYQDVVRHFVEAGKPVAAICQGTRLLLTAGVEGRRLTGISMMQREIAVDNEYVDAKDQAVVDGNIVTVSARPYYHVWLEAFFAQLGRS